MASRYACRCVARPFGVRTTSSGVRTSTLRENWSGSVPYTWRMIWSRLRPALRGPGRSSSRPSGDIVEVRPAGPQELEPPLQIGRRSTSRSICDGTWAMPQKSVELDRGHARPPRRRAPARTRLPSRPARRRRRIAGIGRQLAARRPPRSPRDRGPASPWRPPRPCASCRSRGSLGAVGHLISLARGRSSVARPPRLRIVAPWRRARQAFLDHGDEGGHLAREQVLSSSGVAWPS